MARDREFEPHFTYHGFQYVEVTGFLQKPPLDLLEGCVVASDPPVTGKFECSDPLLNQIWHNAFWSQRGNMHSVPTDCPNRDERYGYGGDALSFAETAMYNMNMAAFFAKWTRDWREAQTSHDKFPPYAPYPYFGSNDTLNEDSMGWSDAAVQIPWKLFEVYQDRRVLEQHFASVKRHIDRVARDSRDGVWNVGTCGDWLSQAMIPNVPGYPSEGAWTGLPNDLFGTVFAYASTRDCAKMARVLGNKEDAARYEKQAEEILRRLPAAFRSCGWEPCRRKPDSRRPHALFRSASRSAAVSRCGASDRQFGSVRRPAFDGDHRHAQIADRIKPFRPRTGLTR